MKDLQSVLKLLVVVLVAAAALAAVLTGRAAVQGYYKYQALIAPRTLHQMTLEMESGGEEDRSQPVIFGAGLAAMAVLVGAGFIVAMHGGSELLRQRRLNRRTMRRPESSRTAPQALPAPHAPMLTEVADDEDRSRH